MIIAVARLRTYAAATQPLRHARRSARVRVRPGKGFGTRPTGACARSRDRGAWRVRPTERTGCNLPRPEDGARRTDIAGERGALAFHRAARGLRPARHAPSDAGLPSPAGSGSAHGRLAGHG